MTTLLFDLEADGLLDTVTKIHCIVTLNPDTDEVKTYGPDEISIGIQALEQADIIVAHNYIGYDRRVIKKFYPDFKEPDYHDTYILSQMLYANEMQFHSIDAWGKYFKRYKPAHEEWDTYSEEMLYRCKEDTQILKRLWEKLTRKGQLTKLGKSIDLEYKVYEIDSEHEYWYLNVPRLQHFIKRLSLLQDLYLKVIQDKAGPIPTKGTPFKKLYKKDGNLKVTVVRWAEEENIELSSISGDFTRINWVALNPKSNPVLIKWLLSIGWKPEKYSEKTDKPLTQGTEYLGVRSDIRPLLQKYNMIVHRLGVLRGFEDKRKEDHLSTFAYTCGTNTARYRHRGVANIPRVGTWMGKMMRSLFVVPEGQILVGCDASQLESRIEGHYTAAYDGGEYAHMLLEEDVHQKTADNLGLTRSEGKTLNYALQYGCSYKKVATLLNVSDQEAKGIVALYWEMRPSATELKDSLRKSLQSRGYHPQDDLYYTRAYIKTIDNRPIFVRSWHSLVNSLIQSTGMICMKVALCIAYKKIKTLQLRARLAIMYHDEFQWICHPDDEEKLKQVLTSAIKEAGEYFKLRVPLESEAKSGLNWSKTH